jgi:hypothetical protein
MNTPETIETEARGGSCAPAPCSARSSDNKIGDFRKELERLLNCMSMENRSDTPDFILAQYMTDCLEAHDRAVNRREVWYGRKTSEPEQVTNAEPSEVADGRRSD